jgi:hypothetical protein
MEALARIVKEGALAACIVAVSVFAFGQAGPDKPVDSRPTLKRPETALEKEVKKLSAPFDIEQHPALKENDVPARDQVKYAVFPYLRTRLQVIEAVKTAQQAEQEFFDRMGRKGWVLVSAPNDGYPFHVFKRESAK